MAVLNARGELPLDRDFRHQGILHQHLLPKRLPHPPHPLPLPNRRPSG
ncbi:MAG TPA: hypothetical protein PL070_09075 [Flavobacteriales bacterium]|nr:hypothetical protein [Flavobacteriales bacterium]